MDTTRSMTDMTSTAHTAPPITRPTSRFGRFVTLALVAVLSAFFAWTLPRADAQPVVSAAVHAHVTAARTPGQQALHDAMRKLWEDHVTWTRLAIVTFADGSPGFGATAGRLLANQADIGDAIKPFYGDAAGNQLTALLKDHINIAVEVLQAAKAGDSAAFADANSRWYANADAIADFLAAANPKSWPQAMMRADMRTHLDQTLAEAAHELAGDYSSSIADYEAVHAHILDMADMLSNGLAKAFPSIVR